MKLLFITVLAFINENNAMFDKSMWLQIEKLNVIFLKLGFEPPSITRLTIEQLENPTPETILTELTNINKQLTALKCLSKLKKRRLGKPAVKVIKHVLMEMRTAFMNMQLEESELQKQFHLTQDDLNVFNYLYDEDNQMLIELNCLYNRPYV